MGYHFSDDVGAVHKTHIFRYKSEIFLAVKGFVLSVEKQHGVKARLIRFHVERALGKDFDNWTLEERIEVEFTAPYIKEQNGPIERAGIILSKKVQSF